MAHTILSGRWTYFAQFLCLSQLPLLFQYPTDCSQSSTLNLLYLKVDINISRFSITFTYCNVEYIVYDRYVDSNMILMFFVAIIFNVASWLLIVLRFVSLRQFVASLPSPLSRFFSMRCNHQLELGLPKTDDPIGRAHYLVHQLPGLLP